MAKQVLNIGSAPNDGSGDPLRDAYDKCNDNFTELYDAVAALAGLTAIDAAMRKEDSESCDGSVNQVIAYSSSLTNAGRPIINDHEGIGIEVTAFDEDGFTITSLSAGTFGYITFIEI